LDYLGFDTSDISEEDTIPFTDIIGKEFKLYIGDFVEGTSDLADAYTLTITGIIRTKPNTNVNLYMGGGLVYSSDVEAYFLDNHQDELGTSLFNRSGIQRISLYPADFSSKEAILEHLDDYNRLYPNSEVIYNDQAALFTTISSGIIDAISIVLIAFASISLVVSSIMIAIITYVSVLERTKEIGVLRALGARKKDISRVFNTENIIIGFSAGSVGILITLILMIPLNIILENLSDIPNIAKLSLLHIGALIIISVFLAFLAGLIPARMAAKKDPVEALRTE
jgi:putative ABC transport system permease protein